MAVELEYLYAKIPPQYNVKLHTDSCFDKSIAWMHTVEEIEFIPMLHGDELVFNSGLSAASEEWVRSYIEELNKVHAGGMIMSFRGEKTFPQKIIDYCNEIRFPIFSATWTTPYIDIMRLFAEILLKNEQRETNLIAALKNAIYYPDNEGLYLSHFERNGFLRSLFLAAIYMIMKRGMNGCIRLKSPSVILWGIRSPMKRRGGLRYCRPDVLWQRYRKKFGRYVRVIRIYM